MKALTKFLLLINKVATDCATSSIVSFQHNLPPFVDQDSTTNKWGQKWYSDFDSTLCTMGTPTFVVTSVPAGADSTLAATCFSLFVGLNFDLIFSPTTAATPEGQYVFTISWGLLDYPSVYGTETATWNVGSPTCDLTTLTNPSYPAMTHIISSGVAAVQVVDSLTQSAACQNMITLSVGA